MAKRQSVSAESKASSRSFRRSIEELADRLGVSDRFRIRLGEWVAYECGRLGLTADRGESGVRAVDHAYSEAWKEVSAEVSEVPAEFFAGRDCGITEALEWAASSLSLKGVSPGDAPSASAWSYYRQGKESKTFAAFLLKKTADQRLSASRSGPGGSATSGTYVDGEGDDGSECLAFVEGMMKSMRDAGRRV